MESQEMEDQKPHICGTCFQVFDSEGLLEIHDQLCGRKTSESMQMEDTEEKPKVCETCCLVFELEEAYQEHKSVCSTQKRIGQVQMETEMELGNNDNKLHVCGICKMVFNSEDLWRNHNLRCSEEKPLVGEIYHFGLEDRNEMIQHEVKTSWHRTNL